MKKKLHPYLLVFALLIFCGKITKAQIGISATPGYTPSSNSMLDISSTTKGLLIPRMTTAQRTTLTATATDGLTVYDITTKSFWYFDGSIWLVLSIGNHWLNAGTDIYNTNTGNVGIGTNVPLGKLTVNSESTNWNLPSILLTDNATTNSGGAILQFRNPADKRMYLQSHFGTMTNGSDTYMTFSHDANYNMRIRGDGNVGIGNLNPNLAGLMVDKKVGSVHAIFGSNTSGVSIESNFPGIHYNSYYNGSRKMISTGYTSGSEMDPTNGTFSIYTSPLNTTIGNTAGVFSRLSIDKNGNVGIGLSNPTALLHLNGNMKINNNSNIELGAGIVGKEVNAGKIGYGVFTPNTIDFVGAGTLPSNRKIRFWAEGGSTFEGPIEIYAPLKTGGNAGTSGQVLTSNGNSAPIWANTSLSNNTRFLVTFLENDATIQLGKVATLTKTIVEINNIVYNLNTTNISISGNTITINKTGLYHLNILLGFNLITAESYYNAAQVYLDLNAGYASPLILEPDAGPFNKGRTPCCPNHAWSCGINKSMDLYIIAGSVLTLRKSFGLYTTNFRLDGNLSGHLISE